MEVCTAFYHRVNDDVFETFLRSFRNVSNALLQVYTDNVPEELRVRWSKDYAVEWRILDPAEVKGQRCYRKMKCVSLTLSELDENDKLIVSDVDTYFLRDPFIYFDGKRFDVAVTTRVHSYVYPVNSGVFFVRPTRASKRCFNEDFEEFAKGYSDQDWFVDQAYMCGLWAKRDIAPLIIKDAGWQYNFCPNTDVFGVRLAANMIKRAYECRAVYILHLKSELKMCIYDGFLPLACTRSGKGGWNWKKEGK